VNSNGIKYAVIVVGLAAAGFFFWRNLSAKSEYGEDLEAPTYWLCANEGCGKEFQVSLGEFISAQGTGGEEVRVKCPACGSQKVLRANPCPHCGRNLQLIGHGSLPEICPHCKGKTGEIGAVQHGAGPEEPEKPGGRSRG